MQEQNNILSVTGLQLKIQGAAQDGIILDDITFFVPHGTICGVVGESGSGKSMTAFSVIGVYPTTQAKVTAGKIEIQMDRGQTDLLGLDENELVEIRRTKIAMIFQDPLAALNPTLKIRAQIMEKICLSQNLEDPEAGEVLGHIMRKIRLDSDQERILNSYPHQLSGGQLQRVLLAMALVKNPVLLIADEPTTSLDVTIQKEILELLVELKTSENLAILFISHDLGVIGEICDYVIVLKDGQIVESGITRAVLKQPASQYTQALIHASPPLYKKLERLPTRLSAATEVGPTSAILGQERKEIIGLDNVHKEYIIAGDILGRHGDRVSVLENIKLSIKEGEIIGLVGESGSGKTTLGKCCAGIIKPTKGRVLYREADIMTMPVAQFRSFKRNAQYIYQNPYSSLNPKMEVQALIADPLMLEQQRLTPALRDKVLEMLDVVALPKSCLHRFPYQLSGGQRQRVAIARALIMDPEFLVCDECVSALDVTIQAEILNLLKDLRDAMDIAMLFISHDISVVHFIADRMAVLHEGEIVEMGDPTTLISNPGKSYTQKLIQSVPQI